VRTTSARHRDAVRQARRKVAVLDINSEAATETARLINVSGDKAASVWQVDALNQDEVDKTVKELLEKYKRIDVWAHIVGGHKEERSLRRFLWISGNQHREKPDKCVYRRTRHLAIMKLQRSGKIVLVSSFAARTIAVSGADYSVAKAGLLRLRSSWPMKRVFNINVNAVVRDRLMAGPGKGSPDGRCREFLWGVSLPEDQAKAIIFGFGLGGNDYRCSA
jgi:NAD(P)-dependent dehydrogenase (short-subunit alcohol dehydrogenase family)